MADTSVKLRLIRFAENLCRPFEPSAASPVWKNIVVVCREESIDRVKKFFGNLKAANNAKIKILVKKNIKRKKSREITKRKPDIRGKANDYDYEIFSSLDDLFRILKKNRNESIAIFHEQYVGSQNLLFEIAGFLSGASAIVGIDCDDKAYLLTRQFIVYKIIFTVGKVLILDVFLKTLKLFFFALIFFLFLPVVVLLIFLTTLFTVLSAIFIDPKKMGHIPTTSSGSRKLVSVTIVNWNSMKYIDQCLKSIAGQTYSPVEIIIVDNCSTDGSLEHIKKVYPQIKLIENKENLGFSKAHNQAFRVARGDFILPLNYDITLEPSFIEEMVKAAVISKDIGMVSGKLFKKIEEERTSIIDSTGITMNNMFSADRGENENDNGRFCQSGLVFGASGAAPLFKKEMLEDIRIGDEYFDEDLFIYVEDVDLCWRAQLLGWKCIFTPSAVAYHERGATRKESGRIKREYLTIGYRNRYLAIYKNSFTRTIIRHFPRILLRETYFFTSHIWNGNFFVLGVPFSALEMIPKMMKKREHIKKRRKVTANYMEKFFFH